MAQQQEQLELAHSEAVFRPDEAIASLFNPRVVKEEMRNVVTDDSMRVQVDLPDSMAAAAQALCDDLDGTAGEEAPKPSEHAVPADEGSTKESSSNLNLATARIIRRPDEKLELVSFIRAKYQILYGRCEKAEKEEAWRWVIEQCRSRNHVWVVGKGYHYLRKSKWPGIKADAVRRYIEEKMTGKDRLTECDKYVMEFISKESVEQAMRQALSLKLYEGIRQAHHVEAHAAANGGVANHLDYNSLAEPSSNLAGATATAFDTAMLRLPRINANDGISTEYDLDDDDGGGHNEDGSEDPTNQPDDFGEQLAPCLLGARAAAIRMPAPRSYQRSALTSASIRSALWMRKKSRVGGTRLGALTMAMGESPSHRGGRLAPTGRLGSSLIQPTSSSANQPTSTMFNINTPSVAVGANAANEQEKMLKRASLRASLKALNAQADYYRLKGDLVRYQIQLARQELASHERA